MTSRSGSTAWIASAALLLVPATAGAQSLPADVDHYLCYRIEAASGSVSFAPLEAVLADALSPAGTYRLQKPALLCNPADKAGEGVLHPAEHQLAYPLRRPPGTPRVAAGPHVAVDQYGTHALVLRQPDLLLVPSSKARGLGGAPPEGIPAVRHYRCRRARAAAPVPAPSPVVADQFRSATYGVTRPTRLCAPADKNGEDPTAPGDPGQLLCYRVHGPRLPTTTVSTDNQIRPERLVVRNPRELCVPALIDPQPTTTTTSSTTSTTAASTTTTLPPPCGAAGAPPAPLCWGTCPPETPICAAGPGGCTCVAGTTPCGSATFPACDGACPPDRACVVSLSLGCTCEFQGIPCAASLGLTGSCGGVCPAGDECVFVSTPDGDGCVCNPVGSTCLGSAACGGTCPAGRTCQATGIPGLCQCS